MCVCFPSMAIAEPHKEEVRVYNVEDLIRQTFPENPDVMVRIADCESNMMQFSQTGTVLVSKTSDVGMFQINQVHWDNAKRLNIDIYTLEGNLQYARYLYDRNGTGDWYMSKSCWNKIDLV